jgi:hypothetical protein
MKEVDSLHHNTPDHLQSKVKESFSNHFQWKREVGYSSAEIIFLMIDIQYIKNKDIDSHKWNNCIRRSINSMVYAEYEYLTFMSKQWDALVYNNYEAVMPLVWNRKWGIKYLYQPAFFQQGGIFCYQPIDATLVEAFMIKAKNHFTFAEITLNYLNPVQQLSSVFQKSKRSNYLLPLQNKYLAIRENYHPDVIQSLKRNSGEQKIQYESSNDFKTIIAQFKTDYHYLIPSLKNSDFEKFEKLCQFYLEQDRLIIRETKDMFNHRKLAMALLLKDQNRLYNIISVVSDEGKKKFANYFLYDSLIKEFAETEMTLDFEGSDIEGVAFFYKKFGTINQPYPYVKFNQLPKMLKWLKR